jgi:SAM-dependent methyltransferase
VITGQCRWNAEHVGPPRYQPRHRQIVAAAGIRHGLRVLDLACGRGEVALLARQQGAEVVAIDIGPALARVAAENVSAPAVCGSMTALPFAAGTFDRVLGAASLHHLSPADVRVAVAEARRVLRPQGRALFLEPIENSRLFDLVQNLVPAKGRPSILHRRRWREWAARQDDRAMTDAELLGAGPGRIIAYHGLLCRLWRSPVVDAIDRMLTTRRSPLRRLAQTAIVEYAPDLSKIRGAEGRQEATGAQS